MIRAANHSSYPRAGGTPLDEPLSAMLEAHARGQATDAELAELLDEVATVVVAEQSRAFINIVTDGMVRWNGPLSRLTDCLEGLEHGPSVPWFDTTLSDRQPVVSGPIARPRGFLVHDYQVASGVAHGPVNMVLPGPVTFARLADDRHYGNIEALASAMADALANEVADLAAAGARHFQLDEPLICRHPDDLELVARTAGRVFQAAADGATTVLSTYFGDLTSVADQLERLPGTHLGLDVAGSDTNLALLEHLPEARGVVLGLFDATSETVEDAADVAQCLAPHRELLTRRDVIVGPQAGLATLDRDQAFDKLLQARYLVENLSRDWAWKS